MAEENQDNKSVILIVEDDRFLLTLLCDRFKKEGFLVIEAQDGQSGLAKIKSNPRPHIVLLDIGLPVMDGLEVLDKIRKDEEIKNIPVVVLSNFERESDIQKAKDLGAKDYMVKVYFTPGEIVEKVKKIMSDAY